MRTTLDKLGLLATGLGVCLGCSAVPDPQGEERPGAGGSLNVGGSGGGAGFGGYGAGGGECAGVSQKASHAVVPVDVIWTIDTSGSMAAETEAVRQNMNQFSQQITAAGVDVRIVLIAEQYAPSAFPNEPPVGICIGAPLGSGKCPNDNKAPAFKHVFSPVGSLNSLQMMLEAYPSYKAALRPESVKILTVVTDDTSQLPAADFAKHVNAIDPSVISPGMWKLYGIFCFSKCPSAAQPGSVYQELVQQTQGVAGDLCHQDFKPVFDKLAAGVVESSTLSCGWQIPPAPAGETFDQKKVNMVFTGGNGQATTFGKVESAAACGPEGGWHFDNENDPGAVLVCPNTCQVIQSDTAGQIDIEFGCATKLAPPK